MIRIEFDNIDPDALIREGEALVEEIKPLLAGHNPGAQGAALAELVALYIAGHTPQLREDIMRAHGEIVRRLVPVADRELFGSRGHPGRIAS